MMIMDILLATVLSYVGHLDILQSPISRERVQIQRDGYKCYFISTAVNVVYSLTLLTSASAERNIQQSGG